MSQSDPIRVDDYLGHIIEAIDNISEYTEDMDLVAYGTLFKPPPAAQHCGGRHHFVNAHN